ncbi:MAG: Maf family protein [Hyphomicrobiales bacterium]
MSLQSPAASLILASASKARASVLTAAGLTFRVHPAAIDEAAIRATLEKGDADITPADVAVVLAQTKAAAVSESHQGHLVIGADQVLVCDGTIYGKPGDHDAARDQLLSLRNKTHSLISAVACARDGAVIWHHDQTALLTMRDFSNDFLGQYLAAVGHAVTESVGGYQIEGPGSQLFSAVDGDHFTILGVPLLPLLSFLRTQNILPE